MAGIAEAALGVGTEAALALIEDKASLGVWNWDLDADRWEWSAGMYRIMGLDPYSRQPSLELYRELVHPDDRLDLGDPTMLAASHTFEDRRFRIIRPDGEMRWIRSCGKIVHRRDGTPTRLSGVAFDITELRRGLEAYQQETGLLTAARELLGGIIWKTAADGSVDDPMEWRTGAGGPGDSHAGWRRLNEVHPEDRHLIREAWDTALRNRTRFAAQYRALSQGQYQYISSRAVPIRNARGDIMAWIGFSTARPVAEPPATALPAATATISPAQIRAARGFLGWSARDLAERAGVSFSTARRVETAGNSPVGKRAAAAVRQAFENSGIRFTTAPDGTIGISFHPPARA